VQNASNEIGQISLFVALFVLNRSFYLCRTKVFVAKKFNLVLVLSREMMFNCASICVEK